MSGGGERAALFLGGWRCSLSKGPDGWIDGWQGGGGGGEMNGYAKQIMAGLRWFDNKAH